jgi:hypothetical protein
MIGLKFCTFVRFMATDQATSRRSEHSMMSGEVARRATHHRTFEAAFSFCGRNCSEGENNGSASNEHFHLNLRS